ncbi:dTMP kinase, partial [Acinetobacter baumannii]|uniref:dTMP kinase n=1 Tax=Acinetobacter baumannii TaxID=470 RepID=UPI0027D2DC6F
MPALANGTIVLCDRYVDASMAYQGYGLGLPLAEVAHINRFATGGLTPDLTYFLEVPAEVSRERLQQRFSQQEGPDRIESKPAAYHERVRQGFAEICREHTDRIVTVDAVRD